MKKPAPIRAVTPAAKTPAPSGATSPALRRYLYFTAAMTGGVLMVVEILGAKMLSPYVGTSHFVWVAQIGITLAALASGYYLGGRLADRSSGLGRLYAAIIVAGLWLGLTVPACEPVAFACLDFSLPVGTVLASLSLFFVPLTLLAMTGPFLIRTLSDSLQNIGASVGRLSAISTVGSFVGTAAIGYALIPLLPNSYTMLLNAGLLMVIATIYFVIWGRKGRTELPVILVWGLFALISFNAANAKSARLAGTKELFRGNSHFGMLQVIEARDGKRYYLNDFLTQNTYDPAANQSTTLFTFMLAGLARTYTTNLQSALCIGMGIGIVPMDFARSGVKTSVVEINPAVVPVAQRFFNFDPSLVKLTIGDGRYFLNRDTNRYDAIALDAFLGDSSPAHLMSREAFASMKRHLRPDGVLVINSFGELEPGENFFTASLDKTLRAVFKSVRIHASGNGNVFFVATDQAEFRAHHPFDFEHVYSRVQADAKEALERTLTMDPKEGLVLTDDYNPVEYYDAANREQVRKNLAFSMKPK